MAQLNARQRKVTHRTHEGAPAKRIDAEAQLRRALMANLLWEKSFYEGGAAIGDRLRELVAAVPLETAARLAIEAREEMHLRHAPLLVVREMARRGGAIVGDTLARVIQRADELAEFLALYWSEGKEPLSAQVKRGLAAAFGKFSAYDLAKYDREREVRMRDVLFLCHAKPKDAEQAALWKRLIAGELESPDTWEVALSSGAPKRETWERLLEERMLGGLALLRNLRNMLEAGVPEEVIAAGIAANEFRRVLPFRFIAAARYAPQLEPSLEAALFRGMEGMAKLPGRTALVVDHSCSMVEKLSAKSDMRRFDAACGVAMLLREVAQDVRIYAFSEDWRKRYPRESAENMNARFRTGNRGGDVGVHAERPAFARVAPRRGFALRDALDAATCWWGTDTAAGKAMADKDGYDRLIIITDEQSATPLTKPAGAAPGYVVNIGTEKNGIGYGQHWTHIDGWSESVVRYIQAAEGGRPD